jgi:hypothetical protein
MSIRGLPLVKEIFYLFYRREVREIKGLDKRNG